MEGKRSPGAELGGGEGRGLESAGRLSEPGKEERGQPGDYWAREAQAPLGAGFHAASQAPRASRQRGPPPPPLFHLSSGSTQSGKENPRPKADPCGVARPWCKGLEAPSGPQRGVCPTLRPHWPEMRGAPGSRASSWSEVSLPPWPGQAQGALQGFGGPAATTRASLSALALGRPHQSAASICLGPRLHWQWKLPAGGWETTEGWV